MSGMCCSKVGFARLFLVVINFLIFLGGAVIFVLGFLGAFHQDVLLSAFDFVPPQLMKDLSHAWDLPTLIAEGAVMLMVTGAIVLTLGFLGCCGALRESKCLLGMYITLVALILLFQVATAIVIIVKSQQAEKSIVTVLQQSIREHYVDSNGGLSVDEAGELRFAVRPVKLAWDGAQVLLSCCGAANATDFLSAEFKGTYNFTVNGQTSRLADTKVPLSCCSLVSKEEYEEGREAVEGEKEGEEARLSNLARMRDAQAALRSCLYDMSPDYMHKDGCYPRFVDLVDEYWALFVAIIAVTALIEALSICFACTVYRRTDRSKPL